MKSGTKKCILCFMIIAIIVLLLYYAFIEYKYVTPQRVRLNSYPAFENFAGRKNSYARVPQRQIFSSLAKKNSNVKDSPYYNKLGNEQKLGNKKLNYQQDYIQPPDVGYDAAPVYQQPAYLAAPVQQATQPIQYVPEPVGTTVYRQNVPLDFLIDQGDMGSGAVQGGNIMSGEKAGGGN